MLLLCCVTLSILEPSVSFSMSHDNVTVICDVTPLLSSKFKIKNKKRNVSLLLT